MIRPLLLTLEHGQVATSEIVACLPVVDTDNARWVIQALLKHGHTVRLAGVYTAHHQAAENAHLIMEEVMAERQMSRH